MAAAKSPPGANCAASRAIEADTSRNHCSTQLEHIKAKGFLVSGIQAKIAKKDDGFSLINLGRRGKTAVNGEPIDQHRLKNGDFISIGKTTFKFIEGTTK